MTPESTLTEKNWNVYITCVVDAYGTEAIFSLVMEMQVRAENARTLLFTMSSTCVMHVTRTALHTSLSMCRKCCSNARW